MTPGAERHALQATIAVAGLVPVSAGLAGILLGSDMVGTPMLPMSPRAVSLDSHLRYLSGLLLGIGLAFWYFVPTIERRTAPVRLLTAIVFLGGLARLYAVAARGMPEAPMVFGLSMELVVTPLICLWQGRVARRCQ